MNASLFRYLESGEGEEFRKWARDHYHPFSPIDPLWHPVAQHECAIMTLEAYNLHYVDFLEE